jgi:GTP-binding protein
VFFDLAHRLMLVDLPGYGHAEAPRVEKDRWMGLVQTYLRKRQELKCVCVLIDGRHGAKDNDLDMMNLLDRAAVVYQLVLTKMDQVRGADHSTRIQQTQELAAKHPAALANIIATSAEDKLGMNELRVFLAGVGQ